MSVTDLSPHGPADLPVHVAITWHEILRTPDRRLRRLLAERYRTAPPATAAPEPAPTRTDPPTSVEVRELDHEISALAAWARIQRKPGDEDVRSELNRLINEECARLEAAAQARYQALADEREQRMGAA